MKKARRTILIPEREYERRPYIFVNSDTGEVAECFELIPLLRLIADAVEDGHKWRVEMASREEVMKKTLAELERKAYARQ